MRSVLKKMVQPNTNTTHIHNDYLKITLHSSVWNSASYADSRIMCKPHLGPSVAVHIFHLRHTHHPYACALNQTKRGLQQTALGKTFVCNVELG